MSELEAVAHGRGDRATYYDKWAKVADDSVAEVEASESAERDAAAAALGTEKHPRSAALWQCTRSSRIGCSNDGIVDHSVRDALDIGAQNDAIGICG